MPFDESEHAGARFVATPFHAARKRNQFPGLALDLRCGNMRAVSGPPDEQPLRFQHVERLPQRQPIDAQRAAQLAFGRQSLSGREFA